MSVYVPHGDTDAAALAVDVDAEASPLRRGVGEVDLVGLAEAADLAVAHQRGGDVFGVLRRQLGLVEEQKLAVDTDDRRAAGLDVQVAGGACDDDLQQAVDGVHARPFPVPSIAKLSPRPLSADEWSELSARRGRL
jgi:hypothetical protein